MRKILIISDTHFSHRRCITDFGRPENFEQMIKHNLSKQIGRYDAIVGDTTLIHLGDVCIGNDVENNEWITDLKCKTILVRGNHDHKSDGWYMRHGWYFVCNRFDMNIFGKRCAFSHIPLAPSDDYDINYHGHIHDRQIPPLSEKHRLISMEKLNYKPLRLV